MNTAERKQELNYNKAIDTLRDGVSSLWFPVVTAAVTLICYYLGLDMVTIWYMALCGSFILIFCKDTTPIIAVFLFMNIMISMENTPTLMGGGIQNQYYFQPEILAQLGVAIGMFACSGVYRLVSGILNGRLSITPALISMSVFGVCMVLNGIFSEGYSSTNAVYGLFMAYLFAVVFAACSASIEISDRTFRYIGYVFLVFAACIMLELVVAYLTYEKLWLPTGGIDRSQLYFGWGMYNTIGMLFVISMPAAAYMATVYKKQGWFFTLFLVMLLISCFMSMSRQAMLFGSVIFVVCAVWILFKGGNCWINGSIFVASAVGAGIFLAFNQGMVNEIVSMLKENLSTGSGRTSLYKKGFAAFLENPIFGYGFYHDLAEDWGAVGLPLVPDMYHNTIIELLAVGGLIAFVPYVVHRVYTVISYVKNPTGERSYIALTMGALLLVSLLDNHIFYMLPTLILSFLTAVLINSEKHVVSEPQIILHNRKIK